jgi:hypothetical protein
MLLHVYDQKLAQLLMYRERCGSRNRWLGQHGWGRLWTTWQCHVGWPCLTERDELGKHDTPQTNRVATTRQKGHIIADLRVTVTAVTQLADDALCGRLIVGQPMHLEHIPGYLDELFTGSFAKMTHKLGGIGGDLQMECKCVAHWEWHIIPLESKTWHQTSLFFSFS